MGPLEVLFEVVGIASNDLLPTKRAFAEMGRWSTHRDSLYLVCE